MIFLESVYSKSIPAPFHSITNRTDYRIQETISLLKYTSQCFVFISINNKRTGSYILFISYYYNYSKICNYYASPSPNTIAALKSYMASILARECTDIITQQKTSNLDV